MRVYASENQLNAFLEKREPGKVKTLVIDPGHGGDKPGALGKHSQEKDLTLSIAKKFGKLVACPVLK